MSLNKEISNVKHIEKSSLNTTTFVNKFIKEEIMHLLKIKAKDHFLVQGLKRGFDMASVVSLHDYVVKNLKEIVRGKNLEHHIGSATVIYSVDENDTIHLITGWIGNRNKEIV